MPIIVFVMHEFHNMQDKGKFIILFTHLLTTTVLLKTALKRFVIVTTASLIDTGPARFCSEPIHNNWFCLAVRLLRLSISGLECIFRLCLRDRSLNLLDINTNYVKFTILNYTALLYVTFLLLIMYFKLHLFNENFFDDIFLHCVMVNVVFIIVLYYISLLNIYMYIYFCYYLLLYCCFKLVFVAMYLNG